MSISTTTVVRERIKSATPESPLALFKKGHGFFDCVFASTVETRRRISAGDLFFVGTLHCDTPAHVVRDTIAAAEGKKV